jgi:hypothetical protein
LTIKAQIQTFTPVIYQKKLNIKSMGYKYTFYTPQKVVRPKTGFGERLESSKKIYDDQFSVFKRSLSASKSVNKKFQNENEKENELHQIEEFSSDGDEWKIEENLFDDDNAKVLEKIQHIS